MSSNKARSQRLCEKHLLLKSVSEKLDLRLISQFRYTQMKARMRRKRQSTDLESHEKHKLPPLHRHIQSECDGLMETLKLCSRTPAVRSLSKLFAKENTQPSSSVGNRKSGFRTQIGRLTLNQALEKSLPLLREFRSSNNSPVRH